MLLLGVGEGALNGWLGIKDAREITQCGDDCHLHRRGVRLLGEDRATRIGRGKNGITRRGRVDVTGEDRRRRGRVAGGLRSGGQGTRGLRIARCAAGLLDARFGPDGENPPDDEQQYE